jgi:hypothetical protein
MAFGAHLYPQLFTVLAAKASNLSNSIMAEQLGAGERPRPVLPTPNTSEILKQID